MAEIKDTSSWRFETKQIHVGQEEADPATDARAVPIYQTTAYVFHDAAHAAARFGLADPGNIYSRLTNSTQDVLERRIAALEGGVAALAVASGAAALTYTFQALAAKGEHIVSEKTIYGGTFNLLKNTLPIYGIDTTFAEPDVESFRAAIRPNTKAIFVETLGNPGSNVVDFEALAELAHEHGIAFVVDATFTPPNLIRTMEYGADIVIHSLTKFIGGHGTGLGGVIVDSGRFDWKASGRYPGISEPNPSYHGVSFTEAAGPAAFVTYIRAILLRDMGAAIAPLNAFLFILGLETLSLRVERHVENTLRVIEYLKTQPKVLRISHPSLPDQPSHELYKRYFPHGAGSIFTFDIEGGEAEAHAFIDRLRIFSLLANVADVKSLVIHPATTTHSQLPQSELAAQGIHPNTVRFSIGTENVEDLIEDIGQALNS
jgi:O-acetylhomoserine (thiol)-lyase